MTVPELCRLRSRSTAAALALCLSACPSPRPSGDDGGAAGVDAALAGSDAAADAAVDAATDAAADAATGRPDDAAGPDASQPVSCPFSDPSRTVGLLGCSAKAFPGYTLFAPIWSTNTYLVDMVGRVVHQWKSDYTPGMSFQLMENGDLLRTAHRSMFGGLPTGGGLQRFTWDGELVWDFQWFGRDYAAHHDFLALPNGNVVLPYWETKTEAEVVGLGHPPNGPVWPDALVEIRPTGPTTGEVVWEWHVWDHLLPVGTSATEHPELVELSYTRSDWLHTNSLSYNAALDQIALSSRNLSELWVIDHSTTTQEAAGHAGGRSGKGGDLLYRWGRPRNYRVEAPQTLFGQHSVGWIEPGLPGEGHLLVFNNGMGRGYSTVDELVTPVDAAGRYPVPEPGTAFGPTGPVWTFRATPPEAFFANHISGAQRLPNGDTLVCAGGPGLIFEVDPAGEPVWSYRSPVGRAGIAAQGTIASSADLFRAIRLPVDFAGFAGRDLTPGRAIEDDPDSGGPLPGDCTASEDCKLCCASLNLDGWVKLSAWMTPCACGTPSAPGPCATACADWLCADAPPTGVPPESCTACANAALDGSLCVGAREKCAADEECLALQSCRLGCPW